MEKKVVWVCLVQEGFRTPSHLCVCDTDCECPPHFPVKESYSPQPPHTFLVTIRAGSKYPLGCVNDVSGYQAPDRETLNEFRRNKQPWILFDPFYKTPPYEN